MVGKEVRANWPCGALLPRSLNASPRLSRRRTLSVQEEEDAKDYTAKYLQYIDIALSMRCKTLWITGPEYGGGRRRELVNTVRFATLLYAIITEISKSQSRVYPAGRTMALIRL